MHAVRDLDLHLAAVGGLSACGLGVIRAAQLDDVAVPVLHDVLTGDEVAVAEPDLASRREAVVLGRGLHHEVVLLDVERAREGDLTRARALVLRVVHCLPHLDSTLGPVGENDLERSEYGRTPQGGSVELGANE